eukprot:Blabericola_migrator_1__6216@NODE_3138_length_2012_cov_20_640103_g1964_i0_p1_GENE_NODE_3138_length_2012_cov_20_640103_g1964_i0NODE_3138_length_2012_cov_20_640103_g1964_i0_p1_ORF_typecomplete_len332_score90_01RsdA_SigD_bd/PF16751_5/4_5RsdA_SigD_bd/PF16751_5/88_NODE_3138_length_2012_cov_20_640103_g1964_i0251020
MLEPETESEELEGPPLGSDEEDKISLDDERDIYRERFMASDSEFGGLDEDDEDVDVDAVLDALKETQEEAQPKDEDKLLDELLHSLPELDEERTLEEQVMMASTNLKEDVKARIRIREAPVRVLRDWRQDIEHQPIMLQWVTQLSHTAKKGLAVFPEFEKAFSSIHLLYLISVLAPIESLLTLYERPKDDEDSTASESDETKKKSEDSGLKRFRVLHKIVSVAFRCASANVPDKVKVDHFRSIFTPDFDPSDQSVRRVFYDLREVDNKSKLAAMKGAGSEILKSLQERMYQHSEGSRVYDDVLADARSIVLGERNKRAVKMAVKRAKPLLR